MYVDLHGRAELSSKESEIATLFAASFGIRLDLAEWRWFYMNNPTGPAYVTLYYDGAKLVGHYGVIPTVLAVRGRPIVGYRSMTTMVHPDGRGRGLFIDLALRVHEILADADVPMVYGFPNGNSAHGFRKYLGWTVLPFDHLIDLTGAELLANPTLLAAITEPDDIAWSVADEAQRSWRLSRPGAKYHLAPGLITKSHENTENILHMSTDGATRIEPHVTYRVLVPYDYELAELESRPSRPYQFGSRCFDTSLSNLRVHREPILSDVF